MILTTVRLERPEGTVLLRGIAVQIEQAGSGDRLDFGVERVEFGGGRAYDQFVIYTTQGVPTTPIQRRDVLFDEQNADPETGVAGKYRVSGVVETFLNDHQEMVAERVVGG